MVKPTTLDMMFCGAMFFLSALMYALALGFDIPFNGQNAFRVFAGCFISGAALNGIVKALVGKNNE